MKKQSYKIFSLLLSVFAVWTVDAQTILKQNGKFGLSDEDGTVVLEPQYDTIEQSYFVGTTPNRKRQIVLYKIPAEVPLFFVKQKGKFAYAYKVDMDSTKVLNKEQVHWIVSEFEFDSLAITSVGSSYYYNSFGFTTMIYKKNEKWGMIYIQTHTVSGGGIFPSAGFYADGMGKQYRTEAKYETIFRSQLDFFHPTFLNGKYGLINPVRGEEYAPEYDTIPIYISDYLRYVKKNGKWGVLHLGKRYSPRNYVAPCSCGEIYKVNDDLYSCSAPGDTIRLYDVERDTSYVPLDTNRPLVFESFYALDVVTYTTTSKSTTAIAIEVKISPRTKSTAYDEIYIYHLQNHRLFSFHDSGYQYQLVLASPKNSLIARFKPDSLKRNVHYELCNIETREFRFAFDLDSTYEFIEEEYLADKESKPYPWIHRFYSRDRFGNERTIGYYDYRTEIFSTRKPKRKGLK